MRLLAALLLLLVAAPAARAAAPPALGPDARVFTLAGGGTEDPREGLPATRAHFFGNLDVAALPDGSVAFTEVGELWRLGTDGRLHDVPEPGIFTEQIAARPDGTLLAMTETRVRSLAPGAATWDRGVSLRRIPFSPGELSGSDLVALPDGFAIAAFAHVYVVRGGAVAHKVKLTGLFHDGRALAALPDGRLVVAYDFGPKLGVIGTDGAFSSFRAGAAGAAAGLAALPDGNVLAAGDALRAVDLAGAEQAVAGAVPGLGNGDGGSPAAALFDAGSVSALTDGSVVLRDTGSLGLARSAFDTGADPLPGGALRTQWLYGIGAVQDTIRALVPAGVAAPWPAVAIAPATYETIGQGSVAYATTLAGHAVLTVTRGGKEVARAEADVAPGEGTLALPAIPPRGDLRLKLQVQAPDGRVATARATATTLALLTMPRVRPLVRSMVKVFTLIDEHRLRQGTCVRQSPQQVACRLVRRGRCRHIATVLLRADGARVYPQGRRACRALR